MKHPPLDASVLFAGHLHRSAWLAELLARVVPPAFYSGWWKSAVSDFSGKSLMHPVCRVHRNRLHKLIIFQAGFDCPIKDGGFYLENLNSYVLQM